MAKKPNIVCDLDGVFVDLVTPFLQLHDLCAPPTQYNLAAEYGLSSEEVLKTFHVIFRDMVPQFYPYAKQTMQVLTRRAHITIATARGDYKWVTPHMKASSVFDKTVAIKSFGSPAEKATWFIQACTSRINKRVPFPFYAAIVEDHAQTLNQISEQWPEDVYKPRMFCMDQSWNRVPLKCPIERVKDPAHLVLRLMVLGIL
jgi:hypothetical protein